LFGRIVNEDSEDEKDEGDRRKRYQRTQVRFQQLGLLLSSVKRERKEKTPNQWK